MTIRRLSLWRGPLTNADFTADDERERVVNELQGAILSSSCSAQATRLLEWALIAIRGDAPWLSDPQRRVPGQLADAPQA